MANFNKLAMSAELLSRNDLRIESTLLGLSKKLVYTPTGATVNVKKYNYNPEAVAHLQRIKLDACISTDKQFAALQLLQFIDYTYQPISKVAFFVGEQAQLAASVIN